MDLCWEWIEDDEDEGLFVVISLIDPFSGNTQAESAFWCVPDGVSHTIRLAYLFDDEENKIPQPIAPVNDKNTPDEFME